MEALSTLDGSRLAAVLVSAGAAPWRAGQVAQAVWRPDVQSFADVTTLPAATRERLAELLVFTSIEVAAEREADGGETVTLLCRLADGQTVETVAMDSPATAGARRRSTVCVSTQVGCAVGCPFCATGRLGLRRNCSAAEVVDQVRAAAAALHRRGRGPVTHVVYMGMGEPLAAYATTIESLRALTGPAGISARRITVSTSGLVPAIDRLSGEGMPVTLAVSLHAADDATRDRLVPLNRAHPIGPLLAAGRRYASRTGRRLTLEWCLIAGVNDSERQADGLRELAFAARAHVNLIPMNAIEGSPWGPPAHAVVRRFADRLRGVRVTVRDTRGGAAGAACGQLRATLEPRRHLTAGGTLTPPVREAAAPHRRP